MTKPKVSLTAMDSTRTYTRLIEFDKISMNDRLFYWLAQRMYRTHSGFRLRTRAGREDSRLPSAFIVYNGTIDQSLYERDPRKDITLVRDETGRPVLDPSTGWYQQIPESDRQINSPSGVSLLEAACERDGATVIQGTLLEHSSIELQAKPAVKQILGADIEIYELVRYLMGEAANGSAGTKTTNALAAALMMGSDPTARTYIMKETVRDSILGSGTILEVARDGLIREAYLELENPNWINRLLSRIGFSMPVRMVINRYELTPNSRGETQIDGILEDYNPRKKGCTLADLMPQVKLLDTVANYMGNQSLTSLQKVKLFEGY